MNNHRRANLMHFFFNAMFASIALSLLGCTATKIRETTTKTSKSTASEYSLTTEYVPGSISELVSGKDVIVVGTMGHSISTTIIAHPTEDGFQLPDAHDNLGLDIANEPVTDFTFTPTDILLSDNSISINDPITVRWNGHLNDIPSEMVNSVGWPQETRQYLLFLNQNLGESPEGTYSPLGGVYNALLIDGDNITYSNGISVEYAYNMDSSEFIEEVRTEVNLQY